MFLKINWNIWNWNTHRSRLPISLPCHQSHAYFLNTGGKSPRVTFYSYPTKKAGEKFALAD